MAGKCVARPRRGRRGDVRGRRRAGWGGTGACLGGAWDGVVRAVAVGRLGMVLVGRGGGGAVHAHRVFDCGSAGRAPATAGRGGGQEQGGRAGVPQGGGWQLQDVLVTGFGAGLAKWPGWWPCPWHGHLGLGFRVWGAGFVSRTCRGYGVRCWTCWFGKWASG